MIKQVKIDQVVYDVAETKGPIIVGHVECKGDIDYNNNLIELLVPAGDGQKDVTLMHEIVHGMIYERSLQDMIVADRMETFVDEMGKSILGLIRSNPNLIKYLLK